MPLTLIILIVLGVVAALTAAEILSLTADSRRVVLRCETDMRLTEPGEAVTLSYRVRNTAFWPLFFVGFSFRFDDGVEVLEDEAWKEKHRIGGLLGRTYSFDAMLPPHRSLRGRIRLCFRDRGLHSLGKVYVETGDFLGFRSRVCSFDIPGRIVCTAAPLPDVPALKPLGGFLGDISVRRFLLEDPSLVLGYRDYTGSEPMKAISWAQTARNGRLMVKNHDFTVDLDVAVLVDLEYCRKPVAERCLSLLRTVCDRLEAAQIPYAVCSNGDLFETEKGVGRKHSFEIQRRIGLSRFVRYRRFEELAARWAAGGLGRRGWIVVTPRADADLRSSLERLLAARDTRLCLLSGEEAAEDA